jgi:hypothetical protein
MPCVRLDVFRQTVAGQKQLLAEPRPYLHDWRNGRLLLWTLNEGVHKPMPASDDGIASFDCIRYRRHDASASCTPFRSHRAER